VPVNARVEIYTTAWCGYCAAAKRLLTTKGAGFEEIDIGKAPERREEMERLSGRHTVPQVFINGESLGGYDDIAALDRQGKLDGLLAVDPG